MNRRTRIIRSVVSASLVLALLAIGGCGFSQQSADQPAATASVAPPVGAPDAATGGGDMAVEEYGTRDSKGSDGAGQGTAPTEGQDRLVVRNASIAVRVDDVDAAITSVRTAVTAAGAEIADLQLAAGVDPGIALENGMAPGPANATITIRVPAEKLDALTGQLAKLGEVTNQGESASDVTEQAIDMEARLKNLRAQEAQLRKFFEQATKVSELLAIEQELARVRGEIESMDAQLTYLKRQAARATLVVSLTEPAPVVSPAGTDWGFSAAVTNGVRGAALLLTTVITVAIALLPLAAVGAAVWFAVARSRKRRSAASQAIDDTGEQPTPDEAE